MASRPIFMPEASGANLIITRLVQFQWSGGFAPSQKRKNVAAMHEAAISGGVCSSPLEVSTKSMSPLGVSLSAFRLEVARNENEAEVTVEAAFQASKVFERGGPYADIARMPPREAKADRRLKDSGRLVGFRYNNSDWPTEPKTAFYDWLYVNALNRQPALISELTRYDAFTDIEFNPDVSISCQARSVAVFLALNSRGLIGQGIQFQGSFLRLLRTFSYVPTDKHGYQQASLF